MKALFTWLGGVLAPVDTDDERMDKLKRGRTYWVEVKQARNAGNHRRLFALIRMLCDQTEYFQGDNPTRATLQERWLEYLCVSAGACDTFVGPRGEVYRVRKSIAWHNMDETEFSELFESMVAVALAMVPEELADAVNGF